jgi:hypothetical protein
MPPLRQLSVYTIAPATGQAMLAFALVAPGRTAATQPVTPIVLSGTEFGVDFNPAADALRIVSDTGQDLRALPSARGRDDPALRR